MRNSRVTKGLALTLAGAMVSPAAELNVRSVVLYKHGVGYFERSGELGAGESARLDFKAGEMNDVLKSLTLDVKGGGGVAGLRYDSSEPLGAKLKQMPIKLDARQPLTALIDQLKGAQLEMKSTGQTVAGAIVAARLVEATRETPEREQVTLLLDTGELRTFELAPGTSVRFPDPKLQLMLRDYLTAVTQARSTDKRSVYIDSSDAGRRTVTASYMIPAPVWKSSYRLIFGATGEPTLEGWAIVDNTTGEDWTNVNLALVSGRPISFISKLYEPRYVTRPEAELADVGPNAPVLFAGTVMAAAPPPPPPPPAPAQRKSVMFRNQGAMQQFAGRAGLEAEGAADVAMVAESAPSRLEATAEGRDLGDLFEYRFGKAVTVKRNESAMLPFLQQKIEARKLLIYSDTSMANPLNAAELTNTTGKTLDGGPVTVYDQASYAGEALVETIKTSDKRLIGYGVDIGTRITTAIDSNTQAIREFHLRRGVLTTKAAVVETKTFTIRNVDAKAKTLIIEQPIQPGYKVVNQKPVAVTASKNRFEVKLNPSSTDRFVLQEERLDEQSYMLTSLNPDFLVSFVQNKALSPEGRKQLETILDRKRLIAAMDRDLRQAETDVADIAKDQDRIRQNLGSLRSVAGQEEQVNRYARQLSTQEAQLAGLRDKQSELRRKKAAAETELNRLIETMEF
ncbi:MAG: DUF4139 domain-containing protein [Bryobacterales bacterium]|nr:DUF4139 domain-containing protein [Bryobacterales bacterium]